ncbi:hypothetical protein [Nitrincola tibetensis]|uniref:hypothetical protein n=1 Tax=Nitrincola tibetensis TaxID=2219697 RepID=UPI0013DE5070|nr:hypothetical protein [Nitrincola tibetensis]
MTNIILCNQSLRGDILSNTCGIESNLLYARQGTQPETLARFTPYAACEDFTPQDQHILSCLSAPNVSRELTNLSLSYGEKNILAIADVSNRLNEYNIGLIGASTNVYVSRMGEFGQAVKEYQDALLTYRDTMRSGATPLSKMAAKHRAERSFARMQVSYRHEISKVNSRSRAGRRGTPLTSSTRGTNIARSSRNVASLNLNSRIEADNLVRFTQYAKFLGNGLTVIDFTSRVGHIHNSYEAGGEWERDLFIESSSFAASAVVGSGVAKAGVLGIGFLMVATPVGWVGLVVGGAAVASTAAAASLGTNYWVKNNAGHWYDSLLRTLRIK